MTEEINDIKKSITEYLSHEKLSRACFLTRKQYEIILKGLDALSSKSNPRENSISYYGNKTLL